MNASYHMDVASGPTIVLTGAAIFTVVFAITGVRGRLRLAGVAGDHDGPREPRVRERIGPAS
jgi:hypothetical protein